ncbi:hypothetical protein ACFV4P_03620 [Kitasatospora sp. NPDC059795]|uniref:hypothetical protein n=1 Tax=Kitasatospora sp. NPDC059795 TaxID=3346949 RepID=UPI0036546496
MAHPVLALGTAAVTAAGSAWYLPALLDLRAGADRPRTARLAAAGCLLWWAGLAAAALLLTAPLSWHIPLGAALTGALSGAALRVLAAVERHADRREQDRAWGSLPYDLPTVRGVRPSAATVGWVTGGLAVAAATAAATLLAGRPGPTGSAVVTVAGSVGLCLLILLVALNRTRPH